MLKIIIGVWFAGFRKGKKDPFAFAVILASSNMKMLMYNVQQPENFSTSRNNATG